MTEGFKGGQSISRNPVLHKMFSYLGYGKRAGYGLSMINDVWKQKGWIMPKIEETFNPNRTTLILYVKEKIVNSVNETPANYTINYTNDYTNNYTIKLTETQKKIIKILWKNPEVKVKEITEKINNITESGVKWNLKRMKDNGLIKREGNNRNGKWVIL